LVAVVDILMPYAESPAGEAALGAQRVASLDGARLGIVNNSWHCMHVIADELTGRFTADLGVVEVVEERISAAQTLPDDLLESMAARCDAVLVGIGN
jgi:hypothetical protein